jgi:hypothetical protein
VPGCSSYRSLHRHHIVFRSHQGSSVLSYLTALCAWHHQRGIHAHVLRCTGVAPDGLRFELGLRDGPRWRSIARGGADGLKLGREQPVVDRTPAR